VWDKDFLATTPKTWLIYQMIIRFHQNLKKSFSVNNTIKKVKETMHSMGGNTSNPNIYQLMNSKINVAICTLEYHISIKMYGLLRNTCCNFDSILHANEWS
jgi:hypothetical protein